MINTLSAALEKRGQEFLSDTVIITEKLDTFRILFEKVGDEVKFFKKDNTEINLIERTLSNLWEQALLEIPTLIAETNLPEGIRYGVSYTPVERPNRILYNHLPQYILTDMTKRDTSGKILEIFGYDEINEWAKIFSMGRPPIIFEGELNKDQIESFKFYDKRDFDNIVEDNFTEILEKVGGSYSKEKIIEGIIIKDSKGNICQVLSYEFELLNEAYKKHSAPRDFYDLVILSLNNFMKKYSIPVFEASNFDQTYINIISDLFNKYVETNPLTESFKSDLLTPPRYGYSGRLNTKFIKNEKTLELLQESAAHEALFKVVLSSFRKYKKQYGLLSEGDVQQFNTYVGLINEGLKYIEDAEDKTTTHLNDNVLNESNRSDNIVVDSYINKKASDIDNMRVIASVQKAFQPKKLDVRKGVENCVVYVTDFNPFSKSQMDNVEAIFRSWKVPVIIATISNKRRVEGEKFKFSDEMIKAQMQSIHIFNKDIIVDSFMMSDWNLVEIYEFVRPKYEPLAIITDKGKKSEFVIQLFFEEEVMGGRIGVENKLNIGEMDTTDKLKAIRSLEDVSFVQFKENTPQAIWNLFDSMNSELKRFNGQILI